MIVWELWRRPRRQRLWHHRFEGRKPWYARRTLLIRRGRRHIAHRVGCDGSHLVGPPWQVNATIVRVVREHRLNVRHRRFSFALPLIRLSALAGQR